MLFSNIGFLTGVKTLEEGFWARLLEGFSTAGQTGVGHEVAVRIKRLFVFGRLYAPARTIRQDPVALLIVEQIGDHDLTENLLMHGRIENRQHCLDSAVEIARHEVGRRNINMCLGVRQIMAATKTIHPGMFEKPADDRFDPYVFGQALDTWSEAANPAHDEVNIDPRVACFVESIDDLWIDKGIAFCPDRAGLAGFDEGDLLSNMFEKPRFERDWRDRHAFEPSGLCIAGDIIENPRDVAPDDRIGGEEGNVRIDLGRHRVIISGAHMTISHERASFAAHDHGQFGMRLQLDETEHDLRAGAFEIARPADVGGLVEARLEFDKRRDRLAGFRRLDEGAHDRAVGRGAVKRLLDRDDIGIGRCLVQELDHDIERFIRVVDDEILLFDREKAIAAIVADALGKARIVRLELKLRPVKAYEFGKFV